MKRFIVAMLVALCATFAPLAAPIARADAGFPFVYDTSLQPTLFGARLAVYTHIKGILYGRTGSVRVCFYPVSGITIDEMRVHSGSYDPPIVSFNSGTELKNHVFYTGTTGTSGGSSVGYLCTHQRWERYAGSPSPRTAELDAYNTAYGYNFWLDDVGDYVNTACVYVTIRAADDVYPNDGAQVTSGTVCF